jgi:hypothetical protein
MSDTSGNGWDEYRRLVMDSLDRLAREIRHERSEAKTAQNRLLDRLSEQDKELAMLKVRCGIWGLMGGLIPSMTALALTKLQ